MVEYMAIKQKQDLIFLIRSPTCLYDPVDENNITYNICIFGEVPIQIFVVNVEQPVVFKTCCKTLAFQEMFFQSFLVHWKAVD